MCDPNILQKWLLHGKPMVGYLQRLVLACLTKFPWVSWVSQTYRPPQEAATHPRAEGARGFLAWRNRLLPVPYFKRWHWWRMQWTQWVQAWEFTQLDHWDAETRSVTGSCLSLQKIHGHAAYWCIPIAGQLIQNVDSQHVHIPRSNLFKT